MSWDHDSWVAAWGRNATVWAIQDYRLPTPPPGLAWSVTRQLVDGQRSVRVSLVRVEPVVLSAVCGPANTEVDNTARQMLSDPALQPTSCYGQPVVPIHPEGQHE